MKMRKVLAIFLVSMTWIVPRVVAQSPVPILSVDVDADRHRISPLIYGINYYAADESVFDTVPLTLQRLGGNNTTNYNWLVDSSNSGSDFFFIGGQGIPQSQVIPGQLVDTMVKFDKNHKAASMITIPVIGYVNKYSEWNCSYPQSLYPSQGLQWGAFDFWPFITDLNGSLCGSGLTPDNSGAQLTDENPLLNYVVADPSWMHGWISHLTQEHGKSNRSNLRIYQMDNEPESWNYVHHDVHPDSTGFQELLASTIGFASMIKKADPESRVAGPSNCCPFFYYDMQKAGDDQTAHGGIPFFQYYLQNMKQYQVTHHVRILDYFDEHFYPAVDGVSLGNAPAGDDTTKAARLRSTRALWDPTYLQENWMGLYFPDTFGRPMLIRSMRNWVHDFYPGTKTALTEYNWGGLEDINGALAQADILGIFGREGLDLATLWGPPTAGQPGLFAFQIYRNYDGVGGKFGNISVHSDSSDQAQLAIYGAQRKRDHVLTLLIINKTNGDLSTSISMQGFRPDKASAEVYEYSSTNLSAIVHLPPVLVQRPANDDKDEDRKPTRTITYTFPANSFTLFVVGGHCRHDGWDSDDQQSSADAQEDLEQDE